MSKAQDKQTKLITKQEAEVLGISIGLNTDG